MENDSNQKKRQEDRSIKTSDFQEKIVGYPT